MGDAAAAAAAAQREQRGMKMQTSVRTLEDIAGIEVQYWMIENIAFNLLRVSCVIFFFFFFFGGYHHLYLSFSS